MLGGISDLEETIGIYVLEILEMVNTSSIGAKGSIDSFISWIYLN